MGHRPGGMAGREQTLVGLVEIQTKIFEILQSYGSEHKFRAHQGLFTSGKMFPSVLKGVLFAPWSLKRSHLAWALGEQG